MEISRGTLPDPPAERAHETVDRRVRLVGNVAAVLALASVTVTFVVLTGLTPVAPTLGIVEAALATNGVIVAVLLGTIIWDVRTLVIARWRGRAASQLHGRIVALFSVIAVLPAILVAILATITLNRGLDRWFEERTRGIVDNAVAVANAYVQEHAGVLRTDLVAMALDINRAKPVWERDNPRFDSFFQAQASIRLIPAAYMIRSDGAVIARTVYDPERRVRMPPPDALRAAAAGKPVMIAPGDADQVGGILKLDAYDDLYLYIVRNMDRRVTDYLRVAQEDANAYKDMEESRMGVQVAFAQVYVGIALVLLLAASRFGMGLANQLVSPIRRLIFAADQVAHGNLYARVPTDRRDGDLAHLGDTFNAMTGQLRTQRDDLLAANDQIDRRRRFTEAVLAGVTAGVIGVDEHGTISLVNSSALTLLGAEDDRTLVGQPAAEAVPELADLISGALEEGARPRQGEISLVRSGRERIVAVRTTADRSGRRAPGLVVTLDDITDLVAAQRTSAWADVARRIAHEIKNPLTPIQLSAERIKRRYGKRVEDDRGVFDQCIDTIVRQVGDIGRMVDEFSSFARMPKPVMAERDLTEAVREAVFVQSVGRADVDVKTGFDEEPLIARFDHRLITQAVANVVKNAAEAIEAVPEAERGQGLVEVHVHRDGDGPMVMIDVIDNGIGLPAENRQRLLEPYMTTREKGTGLGLAIVGKIMDEHGGRIELLDAPAVADGGRGACVRMVLNIQGGASGPAERETGSGSRMRAALAGRPAGA